MSRSIRAILSLCFALVIFGCKKEGKPIKVNTDYSETYRPQYHFSPPNNWMNDPNGLIFYEGEYHLFYQYHPEDTKWGPMHWGHAISSDLMHWEHFPIALSPDKNGYIFSGSAVIDWKNTSGLGEDGNPAMVAIFTYHDPEGEKAGKNDFQSQGIAYSLDKGRTWKKYQDNPVIKNPGIADFRDPKVIWHPETEMWVMALSMKNKIAIYLSSDLKEWKHSSDFVPSWSSYNSVLECPDLFPLTTPTGEVKWVMIVSVNPGGPNGGSGTQYFIGDFDGKKFTSENKQIKWLDYGADNYAGVTYSDIPPQDGRRILIGWMSNWSYAQEVPTEVWRSAMTIPRTLEIHQVNGENELWSMPVKELADIRKASQKIAGRKINLPSDHVEINLRVAQQDFNVSISNKGQEKIIIKKEGGKIVFDRRQSGEYKFSKDFAKTHYAPAENIEVKDIKILLDRSSVEVFINDGQLVMTELIFPRSPYIRMETQGIEESITFFELKPVWDRYKKEDK